MSEKPGTSDLENTLDNKTGEISDRIDAGLNNVGEKIGNWLEQLGQKLEQSWENRINGGKKERSRHNIT